MYEIHKGVKKNWNLPVSTVRTTTQNNDFFTTKRTSNLTRKLFLVRFEVNII